MNRKKEPRFEVDSSNYSASEDEDEEMDDFKNKNSGIRKSESLTLKNKLEESTD